MDVAEILKIIGITTGPQVLLIITIGFWGKKLIEKIFTESIELKKNELEKSMIEYSHDLELKRSEYKSIIDSQSQSFQTSLDNLKFEFQKKYETQHKRTIDVIEISYIDLIDLKHSLFEIIIIEAQKEQGNYEQIVIDSKDKLNDLQRNFLKRKIYLPQSTSKKIQTIIDSFQTILQEIPNIVNNKEISESKTIAKLREEKQIVKTFKTYLNKDLPNILFELEKEFRKLMNT